LKIVITDGHTLNPGDLSWESIEMFGEIELYPRTSPADVVRRCKDADIIVTNKTPVRAEAIRAAKHLKGIAVTATGYNIIDIAAAREVGVPVCNVPGYGTNSVAQHTFALILELASRVGMHAQSVAGGEWVRSEDFCYTVAPLIELYGKTLGIVGYGSIGKRVAEIAGCFGMRVIYSASSREKYPDSVSLETVFRESDFISLHCPLTKSNEKFVNRSLLQLMKPSAFLVNTARGQLINEIDLRDALLTGTIAGAALDVLSTEPPPADNPLLGLQKCIITPHNAWCSLEARKRIMETTRQNIAAILAGKPVNVVS